MAIAIMWLLCIFIGFASALIMDEESSSYYCMNMNPQRSVLVPQLMGMWFGVEKIDHLSERHYIRSVSSCPTIHISEGEPPSTENPLHRNSYSGYGRGYGYPTSTSRNVGYNSQEHQRRAEEYYRNNPNQYPSHIHDMRYLRLVWDEDGESTDYDVHYNQSSPGFWISSGPKNGLELKKDFRHYAGNIQVLKAVGQHMLLTFCHQLPERQVFSILLSREIKLSSVEIDSVRRMLNRKGLSTISVEKMCNNTGSTHILSLGLLLIAIYICKLFK